MFFLSKWLHENGVLGMNRRNADYILKHNPRRFFPLVDNKILTKTLAGKYGIPTPPMYHVIHHYGDIARFEDVAGGYREFVVKPARGSGGSGIVLIVGRSDRGYVKQNGEIIPRENFLYHISDILSGIYSLEGLEDKAIIEGLIHPDEVFAAVTYKGVPDIRIVAYRGVPVMSMIRLPTKASDGKANLHKGAVGVGVDIGRGITITATHKAKTITHHPDTGNPIGGITVPYWRDMLFVASRTMEMTGLGYVGVDIILDRDRGPMLLELNARPGLQIQLANKAGLRRRLDFVDALSDDILACPELRVEWAMDHFKSDERP